MKIFQFGVDECLQTALERMGCIREYNVENIPKCSGVFVRTSKTLPYDTVIDITIKHRIPLIVFDGEQILSDERVAYLIKNGAFLWEPSVCNRNFFSYQPHWATIPNVGDIQRHTNSRILDLGYYGSLVKKLSGFESYYKTVSDFGGYRVSFLQHEENQTIDRQVESMGITVNNTATLLDLKMTVLIDTVDNYRTGFLDPMFFRYLESGVVPLLPEEHRWYHSIFGDLVIRKTKDIVYFLSVCDRTDYGMIVDIYQHLHRHLPECNVDNVARRIISYIK